VSQIHDLFVQAVARGRETDAAAVAAIADGRAHIGASAVAVGLADRVCTIDESVQFLIDFLTAPASAAAS
jgi:ClpP class serine protease